MARPPVRLSITDGSKRQLVIAPIRNRHSAQPLQSGLCATSCRHGQINDGSCWRVANDATPRRIYLIPP